MGDDEEAFLEKKIQVKYALGIGRLVGPGRR